MSGTAESQEDRWERVAAPHYRRSFADIQNQRSTRADLHAFLLLDELFPSCDNIVAAIGYNEVFLCFRAAEVAKLTDEQMIELSRCGVRYSEDGLCVWA